MKLTRKIKQGAVSLLAAACLAVSCDYLDVVPPEQPNLSDATTTYDNAFGFLGSCYAGIKNIDVPWASYLHEFNSSTDEYVLPYRWTEGMWQAYSFNTASANNQDWIWGTTYKYIGQCLLFLQELEHVDYSIVDEDTQKEWRAEVQFLMAYYHFATLRFYGPIPITDEYISMDASTSSYNGRFHFDYCVDWIANQLDSAAKVLPAVRTNAGDWGRATSTMCKALKSRLLLYAASPLWNGEFPYPSWKNTNFETPGYGYELVSKSYDATKWDRALNASLEALQWAESQGGRELYRDMGLYKSKGVGDPYIPDVDENNAMTDDEKNEFHQHVMKMRYLVATDETDGNREIIWGRWNKDSWGNGVYARLPLRVFQYANGTWMSGWSGVSPTLYTVEHFYTKNGKLPAKDPDFFAEANWFKKSSYTNWTANVNGNYEEVNIANLNTFREPRFYAWIGYDGCDFMNALSNGGATGLRFRDKMCQGYNPDLFNRDHTVTGYLAAKHLSPEISCTQNTFNYGTSTPYIIIRLAELYLNVAECYAAKNDVEHALQYLNPIRERAGIPELEESDVTADMTIMDWVRNERFVELWNEGHRFFDVRRWKKGDEYFGAGKRQGLNAEVVIDDAVSTEANWNTFYQRTTPTHPYVWHNRMYLNPVFYNEVYKNPQMVQAPEY